jgi:Protein of unknown function (DUF3108)
MREEHPIGEKRERHAKSMGKRLFIVLLVAVILLAAGVFIYRNVATRQPAQPALPRNAESPRGMPPAPEAPGKPATSENPAASGAIAPPPGFVPRAGEVLDFAANVTKLNSTVANLKVKVVEHRSFDGKNAWHLQAFAHTENPYRMVFELDDQFDSFSDAANFTGLQYEMHLSERGQKVDTVEKMVSSSKDPAPPNAAAARVLPGTRDPIGMLMYLRSVDWNKTTEVRTPVFDGHKLYDVRAVLVARNQNVSVSAGKFTANKIEIHVLDNGAEMKDAHFLLYITPDNERLPVLMEAVLPFASAQVELTKVH